MLFKPNLLQSTGGIDWVTVSQYVPEAILVGVVLVGFIYISRIHAQTIKDLTQEQAETVRALTADTKATVKELTTAHAANSQKTMTDWRDFLKKEEEVQRAFMIDLRDQQNTAIGRLAEELKVVNGSLRELAGIMTAHDLRVTQSLEQVKVGKKE